MIQSRQERITSRRGGGDKGNKKAKKHLVVCFGIPISIDYLLKKKFELKPLADLRMDDVAIVPSSLRLCKKKLFIRICYVLIKKFKNSKVHTSNSGKMQFYAHAHFSVFFNSEYDGV